jgi:hypothetical protein
VRNTRCDLGKPDVARGNGVRLDLKAQATNDLFELVRMDGSWLIQVQAVWGGLAESPDIPRGLKGHSNIEWRLQETLAMSEEAGVPLLSAFGFVHSIKGKQPELPPGWGGWICLRFCSREERLSMLLNCGR